MTAQQLNLMDLARQGDGNAIATLMNRSLQAQGILAKVALKAGTLKVLLESTTIPDKQVLIPQVQRGIVALNLPEVHQLQIFSRLQGVAAPTWTHTVALSAAAETAAPEAALTDLFGDHNAPTTANLAGDMATVAAHLNQTIATAGIVFAASLNEQILKITVKTDQLLEGDTFAKSIREELLGLNLTNITAVQLYKQKTRGNSCYKIKDFTLGQAAAPVAASEVTTKPISGTAANAASGAKPKGQVNQTRQALALVAFIVLGSFLVWLTVTRLSHWVLSPFGAIGAVFGLPILFKYYKMLITFWQTFVRDEEK
jgi:hypothetical protein